MSDEPNIKCLGCGRMGTTTGIVWMNTGAGLPKGWGMRADPWVPDFHMRWLCGDCCGDHDRRAAGVGNAD